MKNSMYVTMLCSALLAHFGLVQAEVYMATASAPDMGEHFGTLKQVPTIPDISSANSLSEMPFHGSDIDYGEKLNAFRDLPFYRSDIGDMDIEEVPVAVYMQDVETELKSIASDLRSEGTSVHSIWLGLLGSESKETLAENAKMIVDNLDDQAAVLEELGEDMRESSHDYAYFFKKMESFLNVLRNKYPMVYKDLTSRYPIIVKQVAMENKVIHMPEVEKASYDPSDMTSV